MTPLAAASAGNSSDSRSGPVAASMPGSGLLLALFFVTLLLPIKLDVAGQFLYPVRLYLLALFVPLLIRLLSGGGGRLTWVDRLMFVFVGWMAGTLILHYGMERLPYALILALEYSGGYLLGRLLIRNAADYKRFIRYFLVVLLLILPLGIDEMNNWRMRLADWLRPYFNVTSKNFQEPRFGFSRVQVAFPHSILYGLFCSIAYASTYYIYRGNVFRWVPRVSLVIVTTFISFSSGPLISVVVQTIMIVWDKVTGARWLLLAALVTAVVVFLEMASNRGSVAIFVDTFTMSPASGRIRIHIWNFGSASVLKNPFFGIGLESWSKPSWLTNSVDNFWLLTSMRYGLPCTGALVLALAIHIRSCVKVPNLGQEAKDIRTGYLVTLVGLLFTLATVFIWNEVAIFVMFFFGAGAFLYTSPPDPEGDAAGAAEPASGKPYRRLPLSRFPASRPSAEHRPSTARPAAHSRPYLPEKSSK